MTWATTRLLRLAGLVGPTLGLAALLSVGMAAQGPVATWRAQHERQIVDELMQLVAIPNVAGTDADMQRNVEHPRPVQAPDSPWRPARLRLAGPLRHARRALPRGTLTLYIHYDGQPVTATEWTRCKPFAPCLLWADRRSAADADATPSIPTGASTAAPSPTTKAPSSRC